MATPGKVDYHVHYYLDGCAAPEMTLPAIDRAAREMGLEEIAVVKHYSAAMPNGERDWVYWHVVKQEEFQLYLSQLAAYRPEKGLKILSGVETELVNSKGDINIPKEDQDKVDSIALSVHYMPQLDQIPEPFLYHPRAQMALLETEPEAKKALKHWKETVEDLGAAYFVEQLVQGYAAAFARYPKIRQAAHMYDGLLPLRDYLIPYDRIPEGQLIEMMEPLMDAMVQYQVLWELLPEPVGNAKIIKRAQEKGVRFVASADGHSLNGTWGRFTDHPLAEKMIDEMKLTKGIANW